MCGIIVVSYLCSFMVIVVITWVVDPRSWLLRCYSCLLFSFGSGYRLRIRLEMVLDMFVV